MSDSRKEIVKSLILGCLAIVLLGLWLTFKPSPPEVRPENKVGLKLFPSFENPAILGRITIVKRFEGQDRPRTIRLQEHGGTWSIVSSLSFPAGNADQMARVVTPLLRLSVLGVRDKLGNDADVRKTIAFHAECGVLDPGDETVSDGENTGIRVTLGGHSDEVYADAVIGRRVEESSAARDVRYVRVFGDETVYTADFSVKSDEHAQGEEQTSFVDSLSVDPLDWMNRDVLRISRWDIRTLGIHDYPYDVKAKQGTCRGYFVLKQDPTNSTQRAWSCDHYQEVDKNGKYIARPGLKPEEIDNERINTAADTLAHLQLTAVERKSDELVAVLRHEQSLRQWMQTGQTLASFGFAAAEYDVLHPQGTEPCLAGEGGQCYLTMKDGVQLVLVFGAKKDASRYLLVWARVDPDASKEPTLLKKREATTKMSVAEKNKIDEENKRTDSENAIRKSEYELARSEAAKRVAVLNDRFAPWFYLVAEDQAKNIMLHKSDIVK
ncbi:MAG: hypothetical protein PHQ75_12510 [Thermoguttaceae bacterium]|nr:hypothetical protein [Thermoguttaceae bacterium]